MEAPYHQEVEETYLKLGENFGNAHTTLPEFKELRRLYVEYGKNRGLVLQSIFDYGYPLPDEITPEMIALTGSAHACGVAIDLANTRGVYGKVSTYESYTIKNRFDRFVYIHLPDPLKVDWSKPIDREKNYSTPRLRYPDGVDEELIYGINKPNRFFIAQTIRNIELARLDRLDTKTKEKLHIDSHTDAGLFNFSWDIFVPTIESATDMTELAGDLGGVIASSLLDNGLSLEQVSSVLNAGFVFSAFKEEHGTVDQAIYTCMSLLRSLYSSLKTQPLVPLVSIGFIEDMIEHSISSKQSEFNFRRAARLINRRKLYMKLGDMEPDEIWNFMAEELPGMTNPFYFYSVLCSIACKKWESIARKILT
jgi:hypothetical protein